MSIYNLCFFNGKSERLTSSFLTVSPYDSPGLLDLSVNLGISGTIPTEIGFVHDSLSKFLS